jgi:Ca2+-binding RTX toxin-like protein
VTSDYLCGGATGSSINGKEGDDNVIGGPSNDILSCGLGNDVINDSNGSIYGGNG